jgi:hypothetical protein
MYESYIQMYLMYTFILNYLYMFQSTSTACDVLEMFPKPDVLLVASVHKVSETEANLHLDILYPGDMLASEQFTSSMPVDLCPYTLNLWRSKSPNAVIVTGLAIYNGILVMLRQLCTFQINKVNLKMYYVSLYIRNAYLLLFRADFGM